MICQIKQPEQRREKLFSARVRKVESGSSRGEQGRRGQPPLNFILKEGVIAWYKEMNGIRPSLSKDLHSGFKVRNGLKRETLLKAGRPVSLWQYSRWEVAVV